MAVESVTAGNFDAVLPLIADYQRFYGQEPDPARIHAFFGQFVGGDHPLGVQFLARQGERLVGFATLYFLPSSLSARTYCVLNDLYTIPEARGQGVARTLIEHCRKAARRRGFSSLEWQTQKENSTAQRLYDRLGAEKTEWFTYSLSTLID